MKYTKSLRSRKKIKSDQLRHWWTGSRTRSCCQEKRNDWGR